MLVLVVVLVLVLGGGAPLLLVLLPSVLPWLTPPQHVAGELTASVSQARHCRAVRVALFVAEYSLPAPPSRCPLLLPLLLLRA